MKIDEPSMKNFPQRKTKTETTAEGILAHQALVWVKCVHIHNTVDILQMWNLTLRETTGPQPFAMGCVLHEGSISFAIFNFCICLWFSQDFAHCRCSINIS